MLKQIYSNFFGQKLFLKLDTISRKEIINTICTEIDSFLINKYSECSVLFICENKLSSNEKYLILKLLKPKMFMLLEKPTFLRIAECLIATFPFEKIKYIVYYSFNNFNSLISNKEGYFLLRMIIKSRKEPDIMNMVTTKLIEYINKFDSLTSDIKSNVSLICQCFIHNIPLNKFTFVKSCSQHVDSIKKTDISDIEYDMNNIFLLKLIKLLIYNINKWDYKEIYPVVKCAIEISYQSFEYIFMDDIKRSTDLTILINLYKLNYGYDYIKLILSIFSQDNKGKLCYLILYKNELHQITLDKYWIRIINDEYQYIDKKLKQKIHKFYNAETDFQKQPPHLSSTISINQNYYNPHAFNYSFKALNTEKMDKLYYPSSQNINTSIYHPKSNPNVSVDFPFTSIYHNNLKKESNSCCFFQKK